MALVVLLLLLAAVAQAIPGRSSRFQLGDLDFEQPRRPAFSVDEQQQQQQDSLSRFFEVSKPLSVPKSGHCASQLLLKYSFGNTISSPPVVVPYNPPQAPECSEDWDKVILVWNVTSKGRQFDRISAVWLSGVEIFRTSTAEPTRKGIFWTVEKDVTKYRALLDKPQSLEVALANVIDETYTGFFNVTLTANFYKSSNSSSSLVDAEAPADIVLPVALPTSGNGGYWFQIQNSSDAGRVELSNLPTNIYKAKLEVYVSFHGNDEFWYMNPTNDYLDANNINTASRNGPYREVLVTVDGFLAGEICPLPVIFTGGINPLLWAPAAAIGAFDLPSYTLDITPFVGLLVDGGSHEIGFSVTNAFRFWLLDANLHLWLDHGSSETSGQLVSYNAPAAGISYDARYKGPVGSLRVAASRSLQYSGYVESSSRGKLFTTSSYSYAFSNRMDFSGNNGEITTVDQSIDTNAKVVVASGDEQIELQQTSSSYPLHVFDSETTPADGSIVSETRISHGVAEEIEVHHGSGGGEFYWSRLDNKQDAAGKIVIAGNKVVSGGGALNQTYSFQSSDGCYSRTIEAGSDAIQFDRVSSSCIPFA
ncbi:peptide-N4-(N-acetyl-beta-glucosaminyl)asparagine amidase A-like [Selaginella moellendorffii]|uniref:peptide-N4-(N-acetyl-beta- glucosaminyl)asparagine amidase A-like n=1 Tax=Selaginella moellendorffii TaxID=88036 RepID=UPI000D1C56BF|nr:peptide-N4-(N-acetyl-beta-glucosaminyl)asparagine amidase A-like [Selaginella moellendorffii]|eukprot:XP_024543234.1 peptide-N4-(N-acetyl-beta-glucosaminyl)asparagine amidase A-like [Selaginella moellendorffii]